MQSLYQKGQSGEGVPAYQNIFSSTRYKDMQVRTGFQISFEQPVLLRMLHFVTNSDFHHDIRSNEW